MRRSALIVFVIQWFCLAQLWGQKGIKSINQQHLVQISEFTSWQESKEAKTIRGKIVDETGEPVIGANISVPGTSIGTTSDLNGDFLLIIPGGTKSLKISYIGYTPLEVAPENNMRIPLRPDVFQINEIVITAQQQAVQVTAEKITIHPELSPTMSSGNAYSVLKNLPGIIINNDGSLYLNGKSGVKVLVDGKNSYLNGTDLVNYLMSLPASSLNKIELINHPSAKYEAAGNAGIIDISTKKSNTFGYNITVNTNYEQGQYGRSNNNITFGYRQNRLNINGMYGYLRGRDYVDLTVTRDFQETATEPSIFFDQDSYRKRKDQSHYFNFGTDLYANPKTTLGIAVRGSITDRIENGTLNALFYTLTTPNDSTINSQTDNDEKRKNITSTVYFQHKIDSLGKEICASVNGLYYSINETQFHNDVLSVPSSGPWSESISQALKDGTIKMYSGRMDLAYPINEKLRFDAGAKSDFVKIDNTSNFENNVNSQWINDQILSSTFYYKENINALYINSKSQCQSFTAEGGLRIENTNIKGNSLRQSYTNFFPNLMLSWQLSNSNALNLTYARRIDRPNYRYLNPFVYVFDNYTYEQGNTQLKPQFTDRFTLSHTIRRAYKISLFYANTQQAIIKSYSIQSGTKRVLVMPTNMSSYHSYGVTCDMAQISLVKCVHTSIHSEIVQNNYNWIENGATLKNKNLSFQVGLQNRINLPLGWTGEVSGFYNSRMAYGQMDVLPIWQISGGIQKNFFKERATLSIVSNDWFHANRIRVKGLICGNHAATRDFTDHTILGISFTYRFKKGITVKKSDGKNNIDSKRISL